MGSKSSGSEQVREERFMVSLIITFTVMSLRTVCTCLRTLGCYLKLRKKAKDKSRIRQAQLGSFFG